MLLGTGYDHGAFVVLYPAQNRWCADAVSAYQQCLTRDETFCTWTLEGVVDAIARAGAGRWIRDVADRYVKLEKIEGLT